MQAQRFVNLVFQGGGVRGIAYAGVLDSLPPNVRIRASGGTSAGSIVAALLAIGKTPKDIKEILEKDELRHLIEQAETQRTERFKQAWDELRGIWRVKRNGKVKISWVRAAQFARKHKQTITDLQSVWSRKGLHGSGKLGEFLRQIFGDRTFSDIVIDDLRIVAADVNRQKYRIYSKARNPTTPIREAVHCSVSIPLFFEPFLLGPATAQEHFVDGGLLSNFPSFLFAQGNYPTIGFRLKDVAAPSLVDSTQAYLRALLLTMTDAHDKQTG